jgi:uncharacterized repeat protein (TIGR02543 family)
MYIIFLLCKPKAISSPTFFKTHSTQAIMTKQNNKLSLLLLAALCVAAASSTQTISASSTNLSISSVTSSGATSSFDSGSASESLSAPPTFRVFYYGNGSISGEVPVDYTRYPVGSAVNLIDGSSLSNGNGTFVGWNTGVNGSGDYYLFNNYTYNNNGLILERPTFTIKHDDVKLYPQWAYSISYKDNTTEFTQVPIDNNLYVSGTNKPVETFGGLQGEHYFIGWDAEARGCGKYYAPPSPIAIGTNNITLYAMHGYRVFYSAGNTIYSGTLPEDSKYYHPCEIVNVPPYDNGFYGPSGAIFAGWNDQYDGSGTSFQRGSNPITNFTIGAADVSLYPRWGYTLSYDKNGAEGTAPSPTVYVEYEAVTVASGDGLNKDPYIFMGWNKYQDYPDFMTMLRFNDTFAMTSRALTLYATWGRAITYHPNGATSGTVPVDPAGYLAYGPITVLGNIGNLTKTNYRFNGWSPSSEGNSGSYGANDIFYTYGSYFDLYAIWAPTYLVNYHGNGETGGAVPVDLARHAAGDSVAVLGNSGNLIKSDYAFDDWDTSPFGNGTIYRASNNFNMGSGDFELYARWLPTYSVTYDGNGKDSGSVPIDNNLYLQSATVNVLKNLNNLALTGYDFWGWNLNQVNSTRRYFKPADTFSMTGNDVILSAVWETPGNHMVIYNLNGGSGTVPIDPNSHGYGSGDTVTLQNPNGTGLSNGGAHFAGWNTASDGTGNTYTTSFTMGSGDVPLYAQWGYKITYNGNGNDSGTNAPSDTSVHKPWYSVPVASKGGLTKTGYAFKAWNTESDGSGDYYDPLITAHILMNADVTLYAIWGHIVTYNAGEYSGAPTDSNVYLEGETVSVQYGGYISFSNGDSFLHWNTEPDDSGTTYSDYSSFEMPDHDVTLYAITYCTSCAKITYEMGDATSGTPPVDSAVHNCGFYENCPTQLLGNTGNLVRNSDTFAGWSTDPYCSYVYAPNDYYWPYSDVSMYPCWS